MAILELEPPCIIKFELIPPSKPNFCNFVEFQVTKDESKFNSECQSAYVFEIIAYYNQH
jgi:hypothetical protein